jgi:hypothetical protein
MNEYADQLPAHDEVLRTYGSAQAGNRVLAKEAR